MKNLVGFALLLSSSAAFALQSYCEPGYKPLSDKDLQLDLSKLNQEFVVYQNLSTPPSTTSIITQINICDPLLIPDEPENKEICAKGSLICRRTIHNKNGVDSVDIVQTIARDVDNKLNPDFKPVKSEDDATKSGYRYSLTLNGGEYNGAPQSAIITLECDESESRSDDPKLPEIVNYNNNVLRLQWKTVFACATKVGEKPPPPPPKDDKPPADGGKERKGMSGIGIFFTLSLVFAAVYFIGGAVYNYKMYNARGLDLIPHRDFWLDLPYLIRDLVAHIIDSITSRRRGNSGGYVAV